MKTPREILLGRHDAANSRLNEIRRDFVRDIDNAKTPFVAKLWKELILPARAAWTCIAAAWVVVVAFNVMAGRDAHVSAVAPATANPDSVIALQRQERMMAWVANEDVESSVPAKSPDGRPRSDSVTNHQLL